MDGHTEKQMLPKIIYQGKTLVFMADLLPTIGHIPLPYVMGYDTRPLLTIKEKEHFLNIAADNEYFLFLEHDAYTEICTVHHTNKGVRLKSTHQLLLFHYLISIFSSLDYSHTYSPNLIFSCLYTFHVTPRLNVQLVELTL